MIMEKNTVNVAREQATEQNAPIKKKKRGHPFAIAVMLLYTAAVVVFGVYLDKGLKWMESWLTDYEAAQPNVKSQQVFDELFQEPDWASLYTLAGFADTRFESAEHYAAYMEEKIGDRQLVYYETSAGLSGDHKYIVKLDSEKVAQYTLTAQEHTVTDIPDWQLGTVEIFFTRRQDVHICTAPDTEVFINGVALDEAYTVRTLETEAEAYLPEGLHGQRLRWMYVDGLLVHPQVTAVNAAGEPVSLVYDEETNTYTEPMAQMLISQEETDTVILAAQTYCRYMIKDVNRSRLAQCFDDGSDIYRIITRSETWMQQYIRYRFGEATLSDYWRYSDSLYSVKLTMSLFVTRTNGTEKEYPLDATFFVSKAEDGSWLVTDMVNAEVQQQITTVRLRYIADGSVLEDQMVQTAASMLTPPAVTAPEGKVFSGWYQQNTDEKGNITYSLVFAPDESGTVYLSEDADLQPMVLYALFEQAS